MMQNLVVALIVVAAVLFAAWRFVPAAVREPLLLRMAGAARAARLPRVAQRLDRAVRVSGGCGSGCGSCGGCPKPRTRPPLGSDS